MTVAARPTHHVGRVIVRDPLIVLCAAESRELPIGPAPLMTDAIGARPATFLVRPSWSMERPRRIARIAAAWHAHRAAYPRQRIVMLCNTAGELALLRQEDVEAVFCHQNLVVDETRFTIDASVPRTFDAVYSARMAPYKRHHLAAGIASLVLVYPGIQPQERGSFMSVRETLPRATLANAEETAVRLAGLGPGPAAAAARRLVAARGDAAMPAERVAHWLNRARVGLCLSAEEGAMLASMEYLLCGLPVVSTCSRGGRDHYFDAAYARIVEDDPDAVAAAVRALADAGIDPQTVRDATLARLQHDRRGFVAMVQALIHAAGGAIDFVDRFPRLLAEGLFPLRPAATLVAELAA